MTNLMPASELVTRARTNLLINSPFFGSLAMRLKLVEDEVSTKTFAVDGVSLFYNPEFVRTLSIDEIKTVLAHEVLHVTLGHHERRAGREFGQWNDSADHAVNLLLNKDERFTLPECGLLDSTYANMAAEEIYGALGKQKQEKGNGENAGENGSENGQGGSGAGSPNGKGGAKAAGKGDTKGTGGGENNGSDRGSANGAADPFGEVRDKPEQAPTSASEGSWKAAATSALRQASRDGNLSAAFEEALKEELDPKVPWEELLRQYMTKIAKDDFSWARPNRRFIGNGLYLPSAHSEQMGDIVLAIDVSGSVDIPLLEKFLAEIKSILEEVTFDSLHVLQCNVKVTKHDEYFQHDEIEPKIKGGGGTQFKPVFEWVEEQALNPDVLLYFTDLAISASKMPEDPGYPVIWVENEKPSKYRHQPGFGECLQIA